MSKEPKKTRVMQFTCSTLLSATLGLISFSPSLGQSGLPLNDLSAFRDAGKSWNIAGSVDADLGKTNTLIIRKGNGVLVNLPSKKHHGVDLYTNHDYSDLDLELDYMMGKSSNSGIYFQGRYELQLLDSWGTLLPKSSDNGGIYERWDEKRGKGNEGFDGHAPRQNVSRAPGLWQHLKVSFQAPRFDANGNKIENARFLKVELNGVLIHENLELQGPTRGAVENNEVAAGPLRIQGNHGAVALRNIKLTSYDKTRPVLSNLKYSVYSGKFETLPSFSSLKAESEGTASILSSAVSTKNNEFLIHYTGDLIVKDPGEYRFDFQTIGGTGLLKINNQTVREFGKPPATNTSLNLPAGKLPFELVYYKTSNWQKPAFNLRVSQPRIREFLISDPNALTNDATDPILVEAKTNTILRSFMDIPDGKRIVHAVNVGSPHQLHYTYDLDRGMLAQAWRGGFLDATPMWHSRGDGSSRPMGARLLFGNPAFTIQKLSSEQAEWSSDTAGTNFVVKGYELDDQNNPSFKYHIYGSNVTDAIQVADDGLALKRTININNAPEGLYIRLADSKSIENISKGMYVIGDKSYYIRIDDAGRVKPVIRESAGKKELLLPVQSAISYSILF